MRKAPHSRLSDQRRAADNLTMGAPQSSDDHQSVDHKNDHLGQRLGSTPRSTPTLTDISLHTEGPVSQKVANLELLCDLTTELLASVGADGRFQHLNRAWEAVLGYDRTELVTIPFSQLIHDDDVADACQATSGSSAGSGATKFRARCRAADGSFHLFAWSCESTAGTLVLAGHGLTDIDASGSDGQELRPQLARIYSLVMTASREAVRAPTADQLFRRICCAAVDVAGFSLAWLGLVDESTGLVVPVASSGKMSYLDGVQFAVASENPLAWGPTGTALRERRAVVCNDVTTDLLVTPWRQQALEHGLAASGAFPLLDDDGAPVAVLTVYSTAVGFFTTETIRLLQQMTSDLAFAVSVKKHESELRSTEHFLHVLTDSMAEGIFVTDGRDSVTYVNRAAKQMLGWDPKDLRRISLHDATHFKRDDGTAYPTNQCPLCRVRDEGVHIATAEGVFTRTTGEHLPVTYSAAPLREGETHGVVVVFADTSSRKAEERRRLSEVEQLSWVGRIRDALDENRLVLYAQPIVDVCSREIVSHELLVRMLDSKGDIVLPGRFLPAAERFGLIGEIDLHVGLKAAEYARRGHAIGFNISGSTLGDPDLVDRIIETLCASGADPAHITCEITETALACDPAVAEACVQHLVSSGYAVALDDFGTGYSGLSYLKKLPVRYLKIDREFIVNLVECPQNQHVVKALVNLAQAFDKKLVAEGVEDEQTLRLLHSYGIDYAQGYAIGPPSPADELFSQPQLDRLHPPQ